MVADSQLPDLEVELADLPEEASPSTSPPGEEVTSAEGSASGEERKMIQPLKRKVDFQCG